MQTTPTIRGLERVLNEASSVTVREHAERLEHRKLHAERILFEWACQEEPDTAGTKAALAAYGWKCDFRTMRGNVAELEDAQTGRLHDVEF